MSQNLWNQIDSFYARLLQESPALQQAAAYNQSEHMPEIAVPPNFAQFLHILIKLMNAERILEIGTLGAYSTIAMAEALPDTDNAHIITLERNDKCADVARHNIEAAGLTDKITLLHGEAEDSLQTLIDEKAEPFDLIFIDADKARNVHYLSAALKLTRKGSLILADNTVREGAILDTNTDDLQIQGIQAFAQKLAETENIRATTIQTVGTKGHDGFTMIFVEK